jgi:phosphatidate cytidylyltransferase
MTVDPDLLLLLEVLVGVLVLATGIGWVLGRRARTESGIATVANLNSRIRAWWVMWAMFGFAVVVGRIGSVIFFGLASVLALREFLTIVPTRPGDHRALWWTFFVITPLQYVLVATGSYDLFSVLIPVFAFLFIPVRIAIAGDVTEFLQRAAETQWALMACVYCISYVPALLMLNIPGYSGQNAKLLFFFVLVVQSSDILQYIWGKTVGGPRIAPRVSPNKTLGGFAGGVVSAALLGAGLWWVTPFSPWQAGLISLLIALVGFAGDLTMSAIKRDSGVKDYGSMIHGHGGIMDRIDSICFAAPVFFHVVRYFFT